MRVLAGAIAYRVYLANKLDKRVTLPSYLMDDNGIAVIKEMPEVRSMARAHCGDIDIEGTYPNGEDIMNISKETTYRELHQIQGLTEYDRRMVGINLSGGVANAVEICNTVLQLPALAEIGDIYLKYKQESVVSTQ